MGIGKFFALAKAATRAVLSELGVPSGGDTLATVLERGRVVTADTSGITVGLNSPLKFDTVAGQIEILTVSDPVPALEFGTWASLIKATVDFLRIRGNSWIEFGTNGPGIWRSDESTLELWGGADDVRLSDANGLDFMASHLRGANRADVAAPSAGTGVVYFRDNGGKVELVARFPTGAIQRLAIEP